MTTETIESTETAANTNRRVGPLAWTLFGLAAIGVAATAIYLPQFIENGRYATNAQVREHYGVNVVENPEFSGDTFLMSLPDSSYAHVCDRPTPADMKADKELHCWIPGITPGK